MPLHLIYSSSREKWIHLCVSGPFCYWTLSENTSKHRDHISLSAFFSKARAVPKLTKKAYSSTKFFFFSGLFSFLILSAACMANPLCVWLLFVPIKPALKLESPSPNIPKRQQWKQSVGMFGCSCSHLPAVASLKPLQQKRLWGNTYSTKPSWQKLDDFSARLKGMCLSQSSSAVAIPSLPSTTKPPAQLPTLQKGESPIFFRFYNFLCRNRVLVWAEMSEEKS